MITQPVEQRIKTCIERHPEWDDSRVRNSIAGSTAAVIRAIRAGEPVPEGVEDQAEVGAITLADVKARYDTASAIRSYVAGLKRGVLKLEREVALVTAGKDVARFRRTVDNNAEEFRAFRVKLKLDQDRPEGEWYWGNKETVAEAVKLRDSV